MTTYIVTRITLFLYSNLMYLFIVVEILKVVHIGLCSFGDSFCIPAVLIWFPVKVFAIWSIRTAIERHITV